jgi:DNA repair protein RadC
LYSWCCWRETRSAADENHPGGDPTPSPEDARALVESGKMREIEVLDRLVIGHRKYIRLMVRRLGC